MIEGNKRRLDLDGPSNQSIVTRHMQIPYEQLASQSQDYGAQFLQHVDGPKIQEKILMDLLEYLLKIRLRRAGL